MTNTYHSISLVLEEKTIDTNDVTSEDAYSDG